MSKAPASTLICTLGTSLFRPNLAGLKPDDTDPVRRALAEGYQRRDPAAIAEALAELDPTDRTCGAEINSNALLLGRDAVEEHPNLFLCHSSTPEGQSIAQTLKAYYALQGLDSQTREIDGLQDQDPQKFRTQGLRNLAKTVCQIIRNYDPPYCAINATGGYKAQIAVAVLMGQALGVPVYYKHEQFQDQIIAFPPMPVSLNFDIWLRLSGVLFALDRDRNLPAEAIDEEHADDRELLDCLVERVAIDDQEHVALSATGQIFHETFRERFRGHRDRLLPPLAQPDQKREPRIEQGHTRQVRGLDKFLVDLTREVPAVIHCATFYAHPDLPRPNKFWINEKGLVGQYSDGKGLVKFRVESTATDPDQRIALAVSLNEWLNAG